MDIFDVDHFINVLKDDISISWSTREHYATGIRATRIKTAPVHASAKWNLENVLPMLERLVVTLAFCFRFRVELFFELWDQKNFCSELSLSMIIKWMCCSFEVNIDPNYLSLHINLKLKFR